MDYLTNVTGRSARLITCRAIDPNTSTVEPMPRVLMTMASQPVDLAHCTITDGT